jgi:hypothetical protein
MMRRYDHLDWEYKEELKEIKRELQSLREGNLLLKIGLVACLILSILACYSHYNFFRHETLRTGRLVTDEVVLVYDGEPVMSISARPEGGLIVYGRWGTPVVLIDEKFDGGGMIGVLDHMGKIVAAMQAIPATEFGGMPYEGGFIGVYAPLKGKLVTAMWGTEDGGQIEIHNYNGETVVVMGAAKNGGQIEIRNNKGKPAAAMRVQNIWDIPGVLQVRERGDGQIETYSSEGEPTYFIPPSSAAIGGGPPLSLLPSVGGRNYPSMDMDSKHRIKSIKDEGKKVILDDGSMWEIFWQDRARVKESWRSSDNISIWYNLTNPRYPYELFNTDKEDFAEAKFLGK